MVEGQSRQSLGKSGWMERSRCGALGGKVICVADVPSCNLSHISASPGNSNLLLHFVGKSPTITI